VDPQETAEWLEALEAVLREDGPERAQQLLEAVLERARAAGAQKRPASRPARIARRRRPIASSLGAVCQRPHLARANAAGPVPCHPVYRDVDPQETAEWLEALEAVLREDGPERAQQLLEAVLERAQTAGAPLEIGLSTPYVNSIPPDREPELPGDPALERRLRSIIRWNAIALVLKANKESSELGGHIASYQSAATLYEVGFNHFWRGHKDGRPGDLVFFQGHSSPGFYARAFLEGRITEQQIADARAKARKA